MQISNGGDCSPISLTIFYLDRTAPLTLSETNGGINFWIDDMLNVQNITLSNGPVLHTGPRNPVLVKYTDVASGEY
jgi:hypothetical protein